MSILADILREAPLSAVLQEKIKTVVLERDEFKRQLNDCRSLYDVLKGEHDRLVAEHAEVVRVHSGIEFRRGKRTGGTWQAFCPKCNIPAMCASRPSGQVVVSCPTQKCSWKVIPEMSLESIMSEIQRSHDV